MFGWFTKITMAMAGQVKQGKTNQDDDAESLIPVNGGDATEEVIEIEGHQQLETQDGDTQSVASDIEQQQSSETTERRDAESIASDDDPFFDAEEPSSSTNEYNELEKKAKIEFGKHIKNGAIDSVSIRNDKNDNLCAEIKLLDNNTGIEISEFLNSDFCTENNIAGFSILNANKEKIISGYVEKDVRHYDLGTIGSHVMQFKWYVDGIERSIILTANNDSSIKIVGNKPTDKDLEENADVRIKVGNDYLSLADAVQKANGQSQQQLQPPESVGQLNQPVVKKEGINLAKSQL